MIQTILKAIGWFIFCGLLIGQAILIGLNVAGVPLNDPTIFSALIGSGLLGLAVAAWRGDLRSNDAPEADGPFSSWAIIPALFAAGVVPFALLGGFGETGDTSPWPWAAAFGTQAVLVGALLVFWPRLQRQHVEGPPAEAHTYVATRKTGNEQFRDGSTKLGADLSSFWQWSASDLVSNAMRGVLAEYIVALALGIGGTGTRKEWDAYDLALDDGTKIEVKSSAYVQSWHQEQFSRIQFMVPKRRAWSADTNELSQEARRTADVYVFALLGHTDRETIDPLDVSQWEFFVLPTAVLDTRERSQHSITLKSLKELAGPPTPFMGLQDAVTNAAENQRASAEA